MTSVYIQFYFEENNKIGMLLDLQYEDSQNVVCNSKDLGLFNNCCMGNVRGLSSAICGINRFSARLYFFRRTGPMARGLTRL